MAPEIFTLNYSPSSYTPLSDIWAVGVTAYILFSGSYPFDGDTLDGFIKAVQTQRTIPFDDDGGWGKVSVQAKDFIKCLL